MQKEIATELKAARAIRVPHRAMFVGLIVLTTSTACARDSSATIPAAGTSESSTKEPDILATVRGEPITMADVRGRVGDALEKIETQYQLSRSKVIDSTIQILLRDRVLNAEAKRQGKSFDELVAAASDVPLEPSELDVSTWYNENRARVGNRPLDQVQQQIVAYLRDQRRRDAVSKLQERLDKDYEVKLNFEPYRLEFNNDRAPTLGKADAPVTLVEFSDFQCPYCQGFAPILRRVEKEFGDKVRIVYRQYPIPSLHPNAFKAAEASLCANEQGKFWELHDVMFREQQQLAVSELKEKARRLGMNSKQFDGCLESGKYVEQVQNDQKEGMRAGINGTPAVFINGTFVEGGAVPFETVAAIINRELTRPARNK
jgi:protein-disulfide isomerase